MKKIIFCSMIAIAALIGCKTQKIQVIKNGAVVTNITSQQSFNDENYVWENWQTSTNQVSFDQLNYIIESEKLCQTNEYESIEQ